MENKGLLFIPDISGFTRFVTETEIEHSRYIIQDLLEILINANETGLEISEIEGDAILFYKFGAPMQLEALYKQVEKMFCAFHRHLVAYEYRRLCQCKACISAINLSLKVITHYGEFTSYNVKNFSKLIGKDIIVAHQLLKNDIEQHEYWLVTDSMLPQAPPAGFAAWMQWNHSAKQTEHGSIPFHYTQLSRLKEELPPEYPACPELEQQVKVLSVSRTYPVNIKQLFYTACHPEFRHRWQKNVLSAHDLDHRLPGIGNRYRYELTTGPQVVYVSSFTYNPENSIMLVEMEEKQKSSLHFVMKATAADTTHFTLSYYIHKGLFSKLLFGLTAKARIARDLQASLQQLEQLLQEIEVPPF
jgi:hypothetical protein